MESDLERCKNLDEVREHIDHLDREIVRLLCRRTHFVHQAARFKEKKSEVVVPERIEAIIAKVRHNALEDGTDPELMEKIYRAMIDAFIWHETRVWKEIHAGKDV
ncbi:MAG: chorismate mutase [Alphaproteobacteria bacterium]|nr:chorismate mutase [Alphaproteobacteria bacterium]MBF0130289.1 chorismate mutase [Alphaproteobacteria bacterium]